MKKKLPKMFEGRFIAYGGPSGIELSTEQSAINQIISYLAEREEEATRTVEMPAPWLKEQEEPQLEKPLRWRPGREVWKINSQGEAVAVAYSPNSEKQNNQSSFLGLFGTKEECEAQIVRIEKLIRDNAN